MHDVKTIDTNHYWLYVLNLKDNKYFIGLSTKKDPDDGVQELADNSDWIKKYEFEDILEVIDLGVLTKTEAEKIELVTTKKYMNLLGKQNVRGSSLAYCGKYYKVNNHYFESRQVNLLIAGVLIIFIVALLLFLVIL